MISGGPLPPFCASLPFFMAGFFQIMSFMNPWAERPSHIAAL